ncbi:hypothetical protein L195_g017446, partial [Trifolium pratense]
YPRNKFLGYFLHGLKAEIKGKVRSLVTLGDLSRTKVLQVARAVEKETKGDSGSGYNRQAKLGHGSTRFSTQGSSKSSGSDWVLVRGGKEHVTGGGKGNGSGPTGERQAQYDRRRGGPNDRGFTHLLYNELMERSKKGLCFKCGGPFHPMHQCPDRQLKVLVMEDEEEEGQEGKLLAVEVDVDEEEVEGEISLMSFQQLSPAERPQLIKLKAAIHEVPVLILVDSGATHNFISHQLVHKMNLRVENTPPMSIKLGDGSCSKTKGKCDKLEVDVEGKG